MADNNSMQRGGVVSGCEPFIAGERKLGIIGRERALIDGLSYAINHSIGGPAPSKKTMAELRRHNTGAVYQCPRGNTFEVQIVDPDGDLTGHVARVTVELDRFEPQERS